MVVLLIMLVMDISTSSVTSISMSCGQDGGVYGVADDDGVVSSSLISISMASAPSLIFIISGLWCGWCCRRWWWWMLLKSDLHHIPIKRHLHFCLAWVFPNSTEKWIEQLKVFFFGHNKQFVSNSTSVQLCTDWERRIFDLRRRRIMADIKRTKKVKACWTWTLLDSPLLTPCRFFSCQN